MNASATIAPGPQYMRALERANEVRLARAELKRRVSAGQTTAAAVVLSSPWEARSMAIADLLMSQRRWGRTRCRKFLTTIPMSENKTIGSMTERQRRSLATTLSPNALPHTSARAQIASLAALAASEHLRGAHHPLAAVQTNG